MTLLGPSGSGKTTLLRIIAGLEIADDDGRGQVLFQGENVARRPVGERQVGFVFQHYALFRHMSVIENIAFGLRVRPRKRATEQSGNPRSRDGAFEADSVGRIRQSLSFAVVRWSATACGTSSRTAIEPRVLLLDEPFGALDAKVRQGLRSWLRRLHDKLNMTTVLVTHDQEEALEVADRVVVMNQAR